MRPCRRSTHILFALAVLFSSLVLSSSAGAARSADPSPADWQKDLRILIDQLEAVHPDPWFHTPRAQVVAAADDLSAKLPGMTREESLAGLCRIVSMRSSACSFSTGSSPTACT